MSVQRRTPGSSSQDERPTDVFTRPDPDGDYPDGDYPDGDYFAADGHDAADEWEQALRGDDEPAPPSYRRPDQERTLSRPYGPEPDRPAAEHGGRDHVEKHGEDADHPTQVFDAIDDEPEGWDEHVRPERTAPRSIYSAASYPEPEDAGARAGADEQRYDDPRYRDGRWGEAEFEQADEGRGGGGLFDDYRGESRNDRSTEDQAQTAVIPRIADREPKDPTPASRPGEAPGSTAADAAGEPAAEGAGEADLGNTAEWKMDLDELDEDRPGEPDAGEAGGAGHDARTEFIPRLSTEPGEHELLSGNRPDVDDTGERGRTGLGVAARTGLGVAAGTAAVAGATAAGAVEAPPTPDGPPEKTTTKAATKSAKKAERAAGRKAGKAVPGAAPPQAPASTPPGTGAAARAAKPRRPVVLVLVLALLTLVGAGGAYYNSMQTREATRFKPSSNLAFVDKAATAEVREQVSRAVEAIYSYDANALDQSESRALSFIEGSYVEEFKRNFAMVRQLGPRQKASLTSSVSEAGVENLTERRATLLLMVNQVGHRADTPQPLKATVRLNVTAERAGGQWKVTGIEQR